MTSILLIQTHRLNITTTLALPITKSSPRHLDPPLILLLRLQHLHTRLTSALKYILAPQTMTLDALICPLNCQMTQPDHVDVTRGIIGGRAQGDVGFDFVEGGH